jgi:uncharacterized protein YndB with AHSA1/START domain
LAGIGKFVIRRTFDAPRDVMWKAWTEPERLAQWFGPKEVTIFHSKNDLRQGWIGTFDQLGEYLAATQAA